MDLPLRQKGFHEEVSYTERQIKKVIKRMWVLAGGTHTGQTAKKAGKP